MRLLTAHLENFRSTEELTLDFQTNGVIAIIGAPGSGKSTIIAGLMFAMYGTPGPDQDLLDLRYDRAEPKSLVVADYTWSHNGVRYRTRRALKQAKRAGQVKEIASAQMWRDGVEIDNMTSTLMTAEVTKVLGMGERGLAGSSVIRQGEVDTLTTASPGDVQKRVEEHTGVSVLTKARDNARKAANEARKISDALPGSLPDVADTADAAELAAENAAELESVAQVARAKSDRATANWRDAHTVATDLQQRAIAAQTSREQVVAARANVESASTASHAAAEMLTDVGLDPTTSLDDVTARWGSLDSQRSMVADLGNALISARRAADSAGQSLQQAHADATAATDREAGLTEQITALTAEYDMVVADGHQARAAQAASTGDIARLTKSIDALESASAHCPTCQQTLADAAALIADLCRQRHDAQQQVADSDAQLAALAERARELTVGIKDVRADVDQIGRIVAAVTAATATRDRADAALDELLGQASTVAPNSGEGVEQVLPALRDLKAALDVQLNSVGEQRAAVRASQSASEQLRRATAVLETATVGIVDAPEPADVAESLNESGRLRGIADGLTAETVTASSAAQAAQMGAGQLQMAADVAKNQWARKQKAVQDAEVAATVAQMLAAYREDLIGDFCAGISAAATELLGQFGGEHVAFRLDSDFVPRVELADGRLRKTSTLSGGEKARVGLAFRLGISMQITEGTLPDQMLGDEITSYLDEDGRRGVLEVVRELFDSPVLISHTSEILDHATKVHQLWRSPLGTTEVVQENLAS